jgi:hypothetical protein
MYAMIRRYRMAAGSMDDLMHKVDTQYADRVPEEVGAVLYTAIDTGDGTARRSRCSRTRRRADAQRPRWCGCARAWPSSGSRRSTPSRAR